MGKKVLVTLELSNDKKSELESLAPGNEYIYCKSSEAAEELVLSANIILGGVHPDKIKGSANLEWMHLGSAGSDRFHKDGMPNNAVLTNSTGAYGFAISEYMVGMTFMMMKKLHLYRDSQHSRRWQSRGAVFPVSGSCIIVIGLGDIGGEYAKRMKAMGCYIIGVKRKLGEKPDFVDELYTIADIDSLLPKGDVIALSVPATKDTDKLLSKERIGLLKQSALVLNVGRGNAIDTEALCDAVEQGKIFGAGLDVTEPEPLPENHRMWAIENIMVTPHVSGGYSLEETYHNVVNIALDNYRAYVNKTKLKNVVNFEAGY